MIKYHQVILQTNPSTSSLSNCQIIPIIIKQLTQINQFKGHTEKQQAAKIFKNQLESSEVQVTRYQYDVNMFPICCIANCYLLNLPWG